MEYLIVGIGMIVVSIPLAIISAVDLHKTFKEIEKHEHDRHVRSNA
jgi:hypothetical protein